MTADPSGNSPWGGPSRRGLKVRNREDFGIELFREALEHFPDTPRLKHVLLELSRAYNPVVNGPILDPATRRRILELIEAGQGPEARQALEECLTAYARRGAEPEEGRQERPRGPRGRPP